MFRVRVATTGWQGGPGLQTYYYSHPDQTAANALIVVDHVRAKIAANSRAWAKGVAVQVSGDVDVITAATGEITDTLSVLQPASVTNTEATDTLAPTAVAMLLRLTTATFVGGRRVRGRSFISPISQASNSITGDPSAFFIGVIGALGAGLATAPSNGALMVVWHRPLAGAGGLACQVTGTSCSPKFAVLRSRRD